MYILKKNRKSSQIAIFGSIARNIEGWLKISDLYLIYSQIWLNRRRPRDACKLPFLHLLPMDHGHLGCIKRRKKINAWNFSLLSLLTSEKIWAGNPWSTTLCWTNVLEEIPRSLQITNSMARCIELNDSVSIANYTFKVWAMCFAGRY